MPGAIETSVRMPLVVAAGRFAQARSALPGWPPVPRVAARVRLGELVPVHAVGRSCEPARPAILRPHVGHVVSVPPEEQMRRFVACSIVAVVEDEHAVGDRTVSSFPCQTVHRRTAPLGLSSFATTRTVDHDADVSSAVGHAARSDVTGVLKFHVRKVIA